MAGLLSVVASLAGPTPAGAAGTVLFQNSFANSTVDGTGSVSVPTPVNATNVACLTARGNSATAPLLSCAGSIDAVGSGKLRLTGATGNLVGGVFGQTSFPTSNGLDVTFNSYQWGGGSADGIAFMLAAVDPANPVSPTQIGPSGGSLGYSPAGSVRGLTNAYLGVGLDVYGNYSGTGFQGTGCTNVTNITSQQAGAVVVRGPGNGLVGYCGLTTTSDGTIFSKLALRAATRAASVVPVEVLINPSAVPFTSASGVVVTAGTYKVVVTPVGQTTRTLTGPLPTVPTSLYPSANWLNANGTPKQLAFGFVGSTGSVTDNHEISDVKVLTFNPVPTLAVSSTSYTTPTPAPGDPVTYVITPSVSSIGADETLPVTMTQTVPAGVTALGGYGTGWTCSAGGQIVTCTSTTSSFPAGTVLNPITVVGVVTATGMTQSTVENTSTARASSSDANPGIDSVTTTGTLATTPSGIVVTPNLGPAAGGSATVVTGANIGTATAVEIGSAAEQAAGTMTTLFPCTALVVTGCFTLNPARTAITIAAMPAHTASATPVLVTVVTQGVASAGAYTYAGPPATPTPVTATAGALSAAVSWTVPTNNGSPITSYTVTPFRAGVAQTAQVFSGSTTSNTFTGLTAGVSYTFQVTATNAYGTSTTSTSPAAIPYTVPGAPTAVTATAGSQQATVQWTPPASTGFSPITGYLITPFLAGVAQTPVTVGAVTTGVVPGLTAGASYTFTVAAINAAGTGPASAASAAVVINAAPALNFAAPPAGEVGAAYSTTLVVTGGTSPYTWTVASGTLPPGLSLTSGTGLLSGTPTTAGSYTFAVQVSDASGVTATKSVTVVIVAAPGLSAVAPAGEVGVTYSGSLVLTGGTAPFTYAVSAGSLPPGVTLATATGALSGTPTTAGSYTFTGKVTDGKGQTATTTATIVVVARPTLTLPSSNAQVGLAVSTSLAAVGGALPIVYSVVAGSLPPGLSLDANTGLLSGTPTTVGSSTFTVQAVDANGVTVTASTTVTVAPGPLVIVNSADVAAVAPGGVVHYTVTITNTSAVAYTGVTFTDPLAGILDDATYGANAATTSGAVSYTAPNLTWTGNLAAGAAATITFSVTAAALGAGDNVMASTVTSSTLATTCPAGGVDARCTSTVTVSGLLISTVADQATTTPGSVVRYTTTVTNTGKTAYPAATFSDNLTGVLDDAAYQGDASATAGAVSYSSPTLTWTGSLAAGAGATITYSVRVSNPDTGNRTLTHTAVSSNPGNTCPSGGTAAQCSTTVTVLVPALNITTQAGVTTTTPGATVGFTVTIANTGQTAYTGITVTDSLAGVLDDATYNGNAAATGGSVTFTSPTLTWTGNLAIGATVTITFSATVADPDTGDRRLTVVSASAAAGSVCATGNTNAACTVTVTVLVPALTILKSADSTTTTPGSVVRYTITATNNGQTAYASVTVTDPLAAVLDDATYVRRRCGRDGRQRRFHVADPDVDRCARGRRQRDDHLFGGGEATRHR